MKTNLLKAILLYCTLFTFTLVYAQPPHTFTRYTSEDGLSQKTVNSIIQDHKGYMWFATWDGINKFDGYTFKNYKAYWGDLTGLSNNRIDYIAEDKYGYIWLQNYDNLVYRFNPQNGQFQPIPYENYRARQFHILPEGDVWITTEYEGPIHIKTDSTTHTLTAENFSATNNIPIIETVYHIAQDTEKGQWILTNNGIHHLPFETNNLVSYFVENKQGNHEQKQPFYSLLETDSQILFSSILGRIWCYEKGSGRFTLLEFPTTSHITSINSLPQHRLFVSTADDGFFIYNWGTQSTEHYNTTTLPKLKSNDVLSVFIDSYHEVWLQLRGGGITRFNPETKELAYYNITDKDGRKSSAQRGFYIQEDVNRNLWIHPSEGRLSYYNRIEKQLIPFYDKNGQSNWKRSDRMTAAFCDNQGNLWVSTSNIGLEKSTFNNNDFQIHSPIPEEIGSEGNEVRAVFEDSNGMIWVGSKDRLIRIYDQQMKFMGYLTSTGSISPTVKQPLGMAYTIAQDHKGTIWIGTKGDGLISLVPIREDKYALNHYTHSAESVYSLSDNNIYSIYQDSKDRIWIATYGGGVNYLDYSKNGEVIFINHRNHLKNYPINQCHRTRFITSDDKGYIWIGTTKGLLSFEETFSDPEKITFNHHIRIPGDKYSISNNDIHSILLTRNKELYVATFGGGLNKLIAFDHSNAQFQPYTVANGLPSDIILSIAEDHYNNLWIVTEEEVCKFIPENQTIENYNTKFFPLPIRFNEGASILTRTGNIAVNTNKGVLTFNPDSIHKSEYIPQIIFSQFQLGDKVILPGEDNDILQMDIDDASHITLSHKQNAFSLQYAALDMRYPQDIEYAYKLSGFEKEWNYVGKRRVATYTNIPKGEYTFMVKSTNSDGVWIENARTISIKILPSFWETPWAILLYTLILIAIILIAVYILFTFYRLRDKVALEQKISDIKLRFFTNISHELRTPLTLIAGPIEHILQNATLDNETHEQLVLVEKNTNRMLRLINQILDFRKIQHKKMKMQVQQIDIVSFARHIMENFYSIANEQQIEFTLESTQPILNLWADADKLEKTLFNLLSNAFKYTPQGKQIKLDIAEDERHIHISVKDKGIGIAEHKQKNLFMRFENIVDKNLFNQPTTGIGLSLVKELVEMHKGQISLESKPGEGSSFTISLPKGKAHFDPDTEFILTDYVINEHSNKEWDSAITTLTEEASPDTEKESLLLVEDNNELRYFLKTIFINHFHIIEAENGEEGFTKAKEVTPDIIISDLMMPQMDGIEMMRALRNEITTSHIPIVLLTAKSNIESRIESMELGADDYITKPFSAAYLKARIFNLLEQRKKLQALYCATLVAPTQEEEKNHYGLPIPTFSPGDQKFIKRLIELMEEHMDDSTLMVEELAISLHMSRSVFFKKIKSLIGLSPVEFIKEIRMKRAAELMEESGINIAQIAYMVGFSDPHYFSKCFKQVFSMTPSEYRESRFRKEE